MERFVTAVGALTLISGVAVAGWNPPASVQGTPRDLTVSDGGQVAVATSTQFVEVIGSAPARSTNGPGAVTAFVDSGGCLVVFADDGNLYPYNANAPECAGKYGGITGLTTQVGSRGVRYRSTPGGYAYACSNENNNDQASTYAVSAGGASVWTAILSGNPHLCTGPLSVARTAAGSYGVFGVSVAPATENLLLLRDGTLQGFGSTVGASTVPPRSLALVPDPAGGLRLFAVNGAGGLESIVVDGGLGPAQAIAVPGVTAFRNVSLSRVGNERFGVAIADLADGGTRVLSAVPNPNPDQFGRAWREFTVQPAGLSGVPVDIGCFEGDFCGLYTNATGTANVATYANLGAPTVSAPGPVSIPEGTELVVTTAASDPDGEAVWVALTQLNGGPAMEATTLEDGLNTRLRAPIVGGICADAGVPYTLQVTASDGVHQTQAPSAFTATVTRSSPPLTPVINGPNPLTLMAGAAPTTVNVSPNAAECINGGFVWSPTSSNGIDLLPSADGAQVVVSVPRNVCELTGRTGTFVVRANSPWGMSDAGTLSVKVQPWGPPEPPFDEGAPAQVQLAGTARAYRPTALHVCLSDGGTGPEVFTDWAVDGGVPAGIQLAPDPGMGLVASPELLVTSTNRCDEGAFQLVARNRVTSGGDSPSRALNVVIQPDLDPVTSAQLSLTFTGPGIEGSSSIGGLNCMDQRALQASFVVEDQGQVVSTLVQPVPGHWMIGAVPPVCTPRQMTLYAVLEGTDGGVRSNPIAIDPPLSTPAVGVLSGGPLVARCEAAQVIAEGALAHDRAGQGCIEQSTRWTVISGPQLEGGVPEGNAVTARAEAGAWDDLVDQQLTVDAVAFAGGNVSDPKPLTVPVELASAFVTGRIESDAPIASETGILGLKVVLTNESDCEVRSARWAMSLDGVTYVEGSAPGVTANGSVLEISGVALPPRSTRTLTLNVRPKLLGDPAPRGQLFLGAEPISPELALGAERVDSSGCGCGSTGGAAAMPFALLALLGALRLRARS